MESGGFTDVSGIAGKLTPLMCASMAGDAGLVQALFAEGADASLTYACVTSLANIGLVRAVTALHLAATTGQNAVCVELLLRNKASLDERAGSVGGTPLHYAAAVSEAAVSAVANGCAAAGVPLNINAGTRLNNASALNIAAFMAPPATVVALLALGADTSHVHDHCGFVWSDACQNQQMTVDTLELIKRHAVTATISMSFRPRTIYWAALDRTCEFLERTGLGDSDLVHDMANTAGSTPLHWAASIGRLDIVRWLLDNGAGPSLEVRNRRGRTPLQMANKFGPHLAVEAELSRHELLARWCPHSSGAKRERSRSVWSTLHPPISSTVLAEQRRVTTNVIVW
jgi:ankyrin repeat protein